MSKRLYHIELKYPNEMTQIVKIKAINRETAEKRALKFHPNAKGVKHNA